MAEGTHPLSKSRNICNTNQSGVIYHHTTAQGLQWRTNTYLSFEYLTTFLLYIA